MQLIAQNCYASIEWGKLSQRPDQPEHCCHIVQISWIQMIGMVWSSNDSFVTGLQFWFVETV
jgi:hypothetical protein